MPSAARLLYRLAARNEVVEMKTKNVVQGIGISMALVSLGILAGCLALSTDDGTSGTPRCTSVQDCPTPAICKTMECIEGDCITEFIASGMQCDETRVCDGAGSCVECTADSHCSGTNAVCENNVCISCSDGIKNGSEVGIDCGGSSCAPCPPGTPCSVETDCLDNNCVDGFCCDSACSTVCKSCNQPGQEGTCSSLPKGTEDPGICDKNRACGTNGNCLLKDGQPCEKPGQCLSASCFAGICF
jgi:hypothetical protein